MTTPTNVQPNGENPSFVPATDAALDLAPIAKTARRTRSFSGLRADVVLAAAVFVGALISIVLSSVVGIYGDEQQSSMGLALAYAVLISLPLAFRRRWPSSVAIVVALAYFAAVTLRIPESLTGSIAMFIALFTVGAWSNDRRRANIVRVSIIVGMFAWLTIAMFQGATAPTDDGISRVGAFSPLVASMLLSLLFNALYFGGAYYMGDRAWNSGLERAALEQRTAELEAERAVTSAQAVALDRVRIARELHDVVAHHVSVMGVQAGAARTVMESDPAAAREALLGVESTARIAVKELHQLLETLRSSSDAEVEASTLSLDTIAALVETVNAGGMPTTLTVIGVPRAVPQIAQVNLYRITQEALTNARRHAGAGVTADVRLRYSDTAVEVEVTNSGRSTLHSTSGMGQLGMRERAAISGGTIDIGPRSGARGGYLVRVTVPLSDTEFIEARA